VGRVAIEEVAFAKDNFADIAIQAYEVQGFERFQKFAKAPMLK
jgi:hypothetical protein